ncbi:hypothetical protein PF003_g25515 [Phytophthora fragariae]|nr:hypothetical protein PF003_g25515 [Phytophthora fragariae]
MVLEGLIHDSKMTKKKLSSWVKSGNTMETVGARLGLQQGLSLEKNAEHMNYEALVKFIRMKFEAENAGKQLPSVENVGKYLGVWGLPLNQQRIHANWRAFKRYSKMYAEYQKLMKPIRFSYIGSGYQTEEKTKDIMLKWAMAKRRFADVKQSLGLTGLSGQQLTEHVNYEALQLFKGYVEDVKRLEETVAAATVERFFPALSVQAKRSKKRVVYGWIKDREKIESACDSMLADEDVADVVDPDMTVTAVPSDQQEARRLAVRKAMKFAWGNYEEHAFGGDEVDPINGWKL